MTSPLPVLSPLSPLLINKASPVLVISISSQPLCLQLAQVRSFSASALSPVWEATEDWLHLVADELSEQQGRGSCYSPSCIGGVAMAPAAATAAAPPTSPLGHDSASGAVHPDHHDSALGPAVADESSAASGARLCYSASCTATRKRRREAAVRSEPQTNLPACQPCVRATAASSIHPLPMAVPWLCRGCAVTVP